MKKEMKGRLLVVSTGLLWGLAGVCVKSISWGSMSIITFRSLISLVMFLLIKKSLKVKFTRANFFGGLMMSLTGTLYVFAIKMTNAGTAIVLQYVAPILVFLYEVLFRGKKPKLYEGVLTFTVLLGIILSFADSIDMTHIAGNILALLSGFTFAAEILIMNGEGSDNGDCTIIGNGLSLLMCFPFMLSDPALSFDTKNIIWMLILGIFQFGLANLCFARGCKYISSIECSLLLTIEPIFNPIPVAILCGEHMGALAILGSVIVIVSVTLYAVIPELQKKRKAAV